MPNDLPFEDNPPISEPAQSGEPDHDQAEDDSWSNIEDGEASVVTVTQDQAEPGPNHPSDPAVVPIQPEPKLSEYVSLTLEEMAEKGKALAREYNEIEALKAKRSSISAQIKAKEETIGALVAALTSGQVEVPVHQQDLLRQPVGPESTAAQFADMARDAEAASREGAAAVQGDDQAVADLNKMAADIQAGVPGTEASPQFENDVENFKAKKAKERKGKK